MANKKDDRSLPLGTIELLGANFVDEVGAHIVPIFADVNGAPCSVGSGFLVQAGDEQLLLTAAHVLDNIPEGHELYFYAGTQTKRKIAGDILRSKSPPGKEREHDLIDTGVVILKGEGLPPYPEIGKKPIDISKLVPFSTPRVGKKYAFFGFPSTKGKVTRPEKSLRSGAYSYLSSSEPADTYSRLGLRENDNIVITFNEKNIVHPDGKKMNFPKPEGISGSPLWELRRAEDGGRVIAGIMIEYRKSEKVMVASDIGFALRMLRDYWNREPA